MSKDTTNPATADMATDRSALPLRRLQLIGVAGTPEDRGALLRRAGGNIQTVRVGDKLRQGTVVAIDDDAVILSGMGGTQTLHLPQVTQPRAAA